MFYIILFSLNSDSIINTVFLKIHYNSFVFAHCNGETKLILTGLS